MYVQRAFDTQWYRGQSGLVVYAIDSFHRPPDRVRVQNAACLELDAIRNGGEIALMSGRQIVNHQYPRGEQFLSVRTDGKQLEVAFVDPGAPDAADPALEADVLEVARKGDTSTCLEAIVLHTRGTPLEIACLLARLEQLMSRF